MSNSDNDAGNPAAEATDAEINDRMHRFAERAWFQRILDRFYGYDYFISYRWSDGRIYALGLAEQLKKLGFDCFLDSQDYIKGDNWKRIGERSLRKTSRLVLVGSPEVHQSAPVVRELEIFTATGKRVIPINFEGSLSFAERGNSPLARYLDRDGLWIQEMLSQLSIGPSERTVDELRNSFDLERQNEKRGRVLRVLIVVFAVLAIAASAAAGISAWQWRETYKARDRIATQLAQQLYDNTDEESQAGRDPRVALHLAAHAAAVAPDRDARRSTYIDRAIHLAASLPNRIVNLEGADRELVHAVISDDLRYSLGVASDYTVASWDLRSGARLPVPCESEVLAGFSSDSEVDESACGINSLAISPNSRLAMLLTTGKSLEDNLWVWEIASGEAVFTGTIAWTDIPLTFSRDGRFVLFQESHCEHEGTRTENSRCCRRVIWSAEGTAHDCAELDEPFDHREHPRHTVVVYRGRRPYDVIVEAENGNGRVQSRDSEGSRPERWIASRKSTEQSHFVTVAPSGSAWFWRRNELLLQDTVSLTNVVAAAFHPSGRYCIVLHSDGRLARLLPNGSPMMRGSLEMTPEKKIGDGGMRFHPNGEKLLLWYALEEDVGNIPAGLELRDAETLQLLGKVSEGHLTRSPDAWIEDLAISGDGRDFVLAERNADSVYYYIRRGTFQPSTVDERQPHDKVNLTEFGGLTADGRHVIQSSRGDTEIKLVESTDPTKTAFGPLPFASQRAIQRENTRLLRDAFGIHAIENGIAGEFASGPKFAPRRWNNNRPEVALDIF